ncbi:DUF5959 family protein [Streptomyces sp. NPDC091027]|uniref:DUF5959 family protein n=1 Tax=Streptomyces sp. NPDC091027 TaxID=3365971 RepID=UPI0038041606
MLPDAIELIRLADPSQGVTVRSRSTELTLESRGVRYYDAEAVVTSGFVNGTVHLGFDSEELSDWGRLLDAIEENEQEADSSPLPIDTGTSDPRSSNAAGPRRAAGSRSATCRATESTPGRTYRSRERTEAWRERASSIGVDVPSSALWVRALWRSRCSVKPSGSSMSSGEARGWPDAA